MKNLLKITLATVLIGIIIMFFNLSNKSENLADIKSRIEFTELNEDLIMSDETDTTYIELDTSSVYINSTIIENAVLDFLFDASESELNVPEVMEHIKALDAIIFADLEDSGNLGVTLYRKDSLSPTGMRGIILIDYRLMMNPDLCKLTIYHELGHWFGLEHCSCPKQIMMKQYKAKDANNVLEDWDDSVDKLMKKINKGYNKSESHYAFPSTDIKKGILKKF